MATIRDGNKTALLVVDMQVGVMSEAWDASRIVGNAARAVERARQDGAPVIWVQHSDEELVYGSEAWQWAPELTPAEGEPVIHKQFNSSFEQTTLEEELARLGATRIALAGAATNWCIRATAYAALDRGYDLTSDQRRPYHRPYRVRRRHAHRGREHRPRSQRRHDLAELSRPRQQRRYGR
jgi:nicotinamidase-related amidase